MPFPRFTALPFCVIVLAGLVGLLAAVPAAADQPGELGLYFDREGTQRSPGYVHIGEPFDVYVVGFDLTNDVLAYEFSVEVNGPAFIVDVELNPSGAINFGFPTGNFVVGTTSCLPASGPVWLVRLEILLPTFEIPSPTLCLGPVFPATAGLEWTGGWLDCYYNLYPFEYRNQCLALDLFCPPRISDWTFEMADVESAPGSTALVPLDIEKDVSGKCIGSVNVPRHVEFTLGFNPAIATFEAILVDNGPDAADITVTEDEPGVVRIVAHDINPVHDSPTLDWFTLQFQMSEEPGITLLSIVDIVAWDSTERPVNLAPDTSILTSLPVANDRLSIGALKARY